MGDFQKDLELGVRAQEFIIKQLQPEFPSIKSIPGKFSNFDLKSNSGYTAEVKYDRVSKRTQNVGIEFKYNNKLSGISTTTAIEWIHIYHLKDNIVYSRIRTHDLKAFLRSNWDKLVKVDGGDDGKSRLTLISVSDFTNRFDYTTIIQHHT